MSPPTVPVEIYRTTNGVEAHALRIQLAKEGIDAVVVGDVLETAWGAMPGDAAAASVLVADADRAEARKRLELWVHEREVVQVEHRKTGQRSLVRPLRYNLRILLVLTTVVAILAAMLGALPFKLWWSSILALFFLIECISIPRYLFSRWAKAGQPDDTNLDDDPVDSD